MYKVLSKFYDSFMPDELYVDWVNYVTRFIKNRKSGIDLGSGTGRFTTELLKKGYEIFGVDISGEMLNIAKEKALKSGIKAEFIQGDIAEFQFINNVEFVISMCDVVNYIKNPLKYFKNVYSGLLSGGIFVFDISSKYKLTEILGNNTYSDVSGDITYIWNNFLDTKNQKVDMELTFFEKKGELYKKYTENKFQYIHDENDIFNLLKSAGFENVNMYKDFTLKKPDSETERIHFTAIKQ